MKEFQDFIATAATLKSGRLSQRDLDDLIDQKSRQLDRKTNDLSRTVFANYQSFCMFHSYYSS